MTSYGTGKTTPATGFAAPQTYFKVSAPVLALVAVLGFAMNALGIGGLIPILQFDWAHNIVHMLLAVAGLYLGFGGASASLAKGAAKLLGVVYLALAAIGFISGSVFGIGNLLGLHLELGENLVHLVLGAWAAYVGFAG